MTNSATETTAETADEARLTDCPRCGQEFDARYAAWSRTNRDHATDWDGPHVEICPRCGTDEGIGPVAPASTWPLRHPHAHVEFMERLAGRKFS